MFYKEVFCLLEYLGVGCLLIDQDINVIEESANCADLLPDCESLQGKNLNVLYPGLMESASNGQPYNVACRKYIQVILPDFQIESPDGYRVIFIKDSSDQMIRFITESILTKIGEAVAIYDSEQRLMFINESAAIHEKLSVEDVIGKKLKDLYPDGDSPYATEITLATGQPVVGKQIDYKNLNNIRMKGIVDAFPVYKDRNIIAAACTEENWPIFEKVSKDNLELQRELLDIKKGKKAGRLKTLSAKYQFSDIVYKSEAMNRIVEKAKQFAQTSSPIVLCGETGTGKEMLAQSIHNASPRKNNPFIAVNCAAIPENLLESILFGTEKGAYTGAERREGLFEQAHTGTLLLDEINSMSLSLQAKLLRTLQENTVRRLGGHEEYRIDVRIISTTNVPLKQVIQEGKMRSDLYYRLNVVSLTIPPLREHKEDIPILLKHYIMIQNKKQHCNISEIDPDFMYALVEYDWPGNVRELSHAVEYAANLITAGETILGVNLLPDDIRDYHRVETHKEPEKQVAKNDLKQSMNDIVVSAILTALKEENGNVSRAAKRLGMTRQTLQYRMKKNGISGKKLRIQNNRHE